MIVVRRVALDMCQTRAVLSALAVTIREDAPANPTDKAHTGKVCAFNEANGEGVSSVASEAIEKM